MQIGAVYGKENRALTNLIANIIIEAQHLAGNGRHNGNLLRRGCLTGIGKFACNIPLADRCYLNGAQGLFLLYLFLTAGCAKCHAQRKCNQNTLFHSFHPPVLNNSNNSCTFV